MAGRYKTLEAIWGKEVLRSFQEAKVLVVGAGGIGSELLKALVQSGFESIHVLDLDTIDVSNLNRQFLFRKEHVGEAKAKVAAETARKFNPNAQIVHYCKKLQDDEFTDDWFKQFKCVLSALDNMEARRYLNRKCHINDIPLIESGTRGYLGQVQAILKDKTECYDCVEKPKQKSFAVCTIRSRPTLMVHCVQYAKLFYGQFFGLATASEADGEDQEEYLAVKAWKEGGRQPADVAVDLLDRIMRTKIEELLRMKEEWATSPPVPLDINALLPREGLKERAEKLRLDTRICPEEGDGLAQMALGLVQSWLVLESRGEGRSFDKDDNDAMQFVSCLSNLRARLFSIKMQSLFEVKTIAGNIVPAIATTNACVAGLMVTQLSTIIQGVKEDLSGLHLLGVRTHPANLKRKPCFVIPLTLGKPNPNCPTCAPNRNNRSELTINMATFTLQTFIEEVVKKEMGMDQVTVDAGSDTLYDFEDHADHHPTWKLPLNECCGGVLKKCREVTVGGLDDREVTIRLVNDQESFPSHFNLKVLSESKAVAPKAGASASAVVSDDEEELVGYLPQAKRQKTGEHEGPGEDAIEID